MGDQAQGGASAEQDRVVQTAADPSWQDWGPYLAERAWGTVREDYSADGDAWASFPHDQARSRAYRWNEDGMAGFCDREQTWCLGLALWNGVDPILKERMFGLSNAEGNHGEDAKEYWWYLDATPTNSWQRWRYHYPQRAFPYDELITVNAGRTRLEPEYELADTGIFDDDRFCAVTVDYAKAGAHDLLMRITLENAGPETATITVLPTLWFRNTWSWTERDAPRPSVRRRAGGLVASRPNATDLVLQADGDPEPLFCDNETNTQRLYGEPGTTAYPKDGINDHVVNGAATVNPGQEGTKAALRYVITVAPGASRQIRLRLRDGDATGGSAAEGFDDFDAVLRRREREADDFYAALAPTDVSPDEALVMRQAFAGLLWSKQFYRFKVARWLDGDPATPPPPSGRGGIRNGRWRNINARDVMLMPDPWEYPWFASWDLAFHCVTMAHIDPAFAKAQLILMLREWYMHPSGQLPAYEWNFSDATPPTHAWAALRVFELDGGTDFEFLERVFHKLLMNFTWWTNNQDHGGKNLFEGGFMGLDNIAPLNRSTLPPEVGFLEQADATAWMAMYSLDLLEMALRLAAHDRAYEDVATTFFEHFLAVAAAANDAGLWDNTDAFYYDVLHLRTGATVPLKVRSLVGLIPVTASLSHGDSTVLQLDHFVARSAWFLEQNPTARRFSSAPGTGGTTLLALVEPQRVARILSEALDGSEMLSEFGIRSISAWHRQHPFRVEVEDAQATVDYEPGESTSGLFGGNSNWRGPVWFPLNVLLIEALHRYDGSLGAGQQLEYPAGSGVRRTLGQIADDLSARLVSLFLPGPDGTRVADSSHSTVPTTARWRDNVTFYEYYHGDTGQGLGASHQTGWTSLVAHLIVTRAARTTPTKAQ
ncbi:MAG: glucosidase [Terrimesophilobacter sp.]